MTATHRMRLLLPLIGLLLLPLLLLPSSAEGAPPDTPPEVLQAVHTDVLHARYDGSALRLNTRIGLGEVREADPAGLIFNLEDKGSAKVELPDLPPFAFLGSPGDFVWIAPETQDPELIWPGWNTETIPAGALQGDVVDLTLLNSQGPGNVEVFFNYDGISPTVTRLFSSTDPAIKTLHQPVGQHVHANWAFTALGTYTLTFQATATTAGGAPLTSGPIDYTFVVGPYGPPTPPPTTPTPPPTTPPTTPPPTPPATPPTTPPTTPPVTPTPTPSAPACVTAVLGVGHVDVAARTVGGKLRFQVKDGTQGSDKVVWRDPGTVAFHVRPAADELVPAAASYRFLGAAGATVWQLPQTQADDLLWAGWNTESVDYSALAGPVSWSLDKVQGPGKLALYQFDQFGEPLVSFDSGKALPQSLKLDAPTHAHGNWAFTKQGIYRLTFTYSATTRTGQKLSDTATLPVAVGATDLAALCPGGPPPTTQPPTSQPPTTQPPTTQPPTTPPTNSPTSSPTPSQPVSSAPATPVAKLVPCVTTTPASSSTPGTTTSSTPGSSGTTSAGVTLSAGHADYAVRLEGGSLASRLKDGTKAGDPVWRDPAQVTVRLTSAAETKAPGGAFAFLGPAGSTLWQISQTQKDGVVWLGWNTEELSAAQVSGQVDWRLDQVTGPGALALFEFDSFGQPKVIFNSGDGLPDTHKIPLGTHAHGNWAFTKAGTYKVRFTHTATLASGTTSTDTATITFVVGDTSSSSGGAPAAGPVPLAGATPTSTPPTTTAATSTGGCTLAMTGGSIGPGWIAAGVVLVLLGAVAIVATRRRGNA